MTTHHIYPFTIITVIAIIVLSTINTGVLPSTDYRYADKFTHVAMYAGLVFICLIEHKWLYNKPLNTKIYLTAGIGATILGAMMEGVQAYLPYRSADVRDALCNTLGAALGIITIYILNNLYNALNRRFIK